MIFQMFHYLIHNGSEPNPFHVSLAQLIHDYCKGKFLIELMNNLGICISYHELLRIDYGHIERAIELAGDNRVPVSRSINNEDIIHGAMDNFDHNEATASGLGSSHDTILILFQNQRSKEGIIDQLSKREISSKQKALSTVLPCQEVIKSGKFGGQGKISSSFLPKVGADHTSSIVNSSRDYKFWVLSRFHDTEQIIPSFDAIRSLLNNKLIKTTTTSFTPILPFPITEFDSVFTAMINFQDVLKQKGLEYGPLWSDDGVYHISKDIQLIDPDKFGNIFLGLGGFHLEKVVICCLGLYLELSGIRDILVEERIFGAGPVESMMNGGHYIRGKRGMMLIAEALEQIQVDTFLSSGDYADKFQKFYAGLREFKQFMADNTKEKSDMMKKWDESIVEVAEFEEEFEKFRMKESDESKLFKYWD